MKIPRTELPELRQVALPSKIKRFSVGIDDATITTYESLYDKNTKPSSFQMKVADKMTSFHLRFEIRERIQNN